MSLNTVPTNYHEFEYAKFFLFKLKFMNTGRIHAERWCRVCRAVPGARRAWLRVCVRECVIPYDKQHA